jgi:outer membrane protein assembly factor BamB
MTWYTFHGNMERTGFSTEKGPLILSGVKWSFNARSAILSSPVTANKRIFFGALNRHVYCLDSKTGKEIWCFKILGTLHWSSLTVFDGTVYFGTRDGWIYALDETTGEKKWRFKAREGVSASPAVDTSLTVAV